MPVQHLPFRRKADTSETCPLFSKSAITKIILPLPPKHTSLKLLWTLTSFILPKSYDDKWLQITCSKASPEMRELHPYHQHSKTFVLLIDVILTFTLTMIITFSEFQGVLLRQLGTKLSHSSHFVIAICRWGTKVFYSEGYITLCLPSGLQDSLPLLAWKSQLKKCGTKITSIVWQWN